MSHTEGPWAKPYFEHHYGDRGWWILNGQKGAEEFAIAVTFAINPNAEDDAKLIAAAPELLDALELILPLAKGYRPEGQTKTARKTCDSWIEVAEAVVAKAKGK